jgi:phosphoribosylglycinamide formyltransferase 1
MLTPSDVRSDSSIVNLLDLQEMMRDPIRLAVLISGSGTTLQNFIDRIADARLSARIVQVLASKSGVMGIERAQRAGIPVAVVDRKFCANVEEFSEKLFGYCRQAKAELICLSGFLHLIRIPDDFTQRVINIHPALIPAFCGKGFYGHHVHEAVIASGVRLTGCTVHFADNEYDHGPIIMQRAVPVLDDDTPDSVAARVFEQESEAYPEAIRLFAEGRLKIEGRRVRVIDPR